MVQDGCRLSQTSGQLQTDQTQPDLTEPEYNQTKPRQEAGGTKKKYYRDIYVKEKLTNVNIQIPKWNNNNNSSSNHFVITFLRLFGRNVIKNI